MLLLAKPVYGLVLIAILAATIGGSLATSRVSLAEVQFADYASYQCAAGNAQLPVLRVLTLSSFKAVDLAEALCEQNKVRARFSKVTVSWRKRGSLTAQDIVDQHYDLFLNRRYLVRGLVPELQQYYTVLFDTPTYDVYWVAKHSQPALTAEYFADKVVGLSEDFYSQSFFLLPSNELVKAGIHLRDEQKRFYPDVAALYNALQTGEVDVITNPDIGHWMAALEPTFRLKISEQAPSATWFIKKSTPLTDMHCELTQALQMQNTLYDQTLTAGSCT